jgi:MFS family permease
MSFLPHRVSQQLILFTGQYFGRRMTLAIGQVFIIIGALMQCTSFGLTQMIIARIVTGFGMGHVTATCPIWAVSPFDWHIIVVRS